jgi:hypothetical protein
MNEYHYGIWGSRCVAPLFLTSAVDGSKYSYKQAKVIQMEILIEFFFSNLGRYCPSDASI